MSERRLPSYGQYHNKLLDSAFNGWTQNLQLLLETISRGNSLHDPVTMNSLNSSGHNQTGLIVQVNSSYPIKLSLKIFFSIFVFLLDINSPVLYPAVNACSLFLYIYMEFTNPAYSMTRPAISDNEQYSTKFLRHILFTIDSSLKLIDSQTTEQKVLSGMMVLYNGVNVYWYGWRKEYNFENEPVEVRGVRKTWMNVEDQEMEMKMEALVPGRYNMGMNANLEV
ncbi:uncharacterized protein Bfra_000130 [Botrytis fragariae]|uniref:Uncharacterized protein n=1 Tax=Botrytis fragariae TaxID=1964551 RepID=A0A8H6EN41_9HELO|nr:uncharacterized protein Bfra_000130 [Botrytis fragariae]KAF5877965.1 hypothetical protein Bfra_000130 [Botrytis fragariae]